MLDHIVYKGCEEMTVTSIVVKVLKPLQQTFPSSPVSCNTSSYFMTISSVLNTTAHVWASGLLHSHGKSFFLKC